MYALGLLRGRNFGVFFGGGYMANMQ
jgi:hypothetical protein